MIESNNCQVKLRIVLKQFFQRHERKIMLKLSYEKF